MLSNQIKPLFLLIIFSFVIPVAAQKKRVRVSEDVPPKPPPVKKQSAGKTAEVVKYAAYIDVYDDSEFKVTFVPSDDTQSNSGKSVWVENLFSSLNSKNQKTNLSEIIVRPSMSLSFGELSDFLKKIRSSASQQVKVQLDEDILAEISKPLSKTIKPNPLFLLVNLEADGKVSLNNEPSGSIDDLLQLQTFLTKIFNDRMNYGVFREGTNEVNKEVFIKVPNTVKLLELKNLARGVRDSGAVPIGLQIDDFIRTDVIEKLN